MNDSRTALGWRSIQISWRSVASGRPKTSSANERRTSRGWREHPALLGLGGGAGGGSGDRAGRGQDRAFGGGRHGRARVLGAAEGPVVRGAEGVEHAVEDRVGVDGGRRARARAPPRRRARGPPTRSCRRRSPAGSGSARPRARARARLGSTGSGSGAAGSGCLRPNRRAQKPRLGVLDRGGRLHDRLLGLGRRLRLGVGSRPPRAPLRPPPTGGLFGLRLGDRGGLRRIDREHHARPPSRGLEPDGPARAVRLPFDSGLGVHLGDPDLPELAEMAGQGAEVGQLCPQLGR